MTMRQWGGAAVLAMLVAYGTTAPSVVAQALAEWLQRRGQELMVRQANWCQRSR